MAAEDEDLSGPGGTTPVPGPGSGPEPRPETRSEPRSVPELMLGRPPMARPLPGFDTGAAPAEPGPLLVDWLATALDAGVLDPQVFTLSTVDADGLPDARVLVLRDVDASGTGWVFSAAADSPKGRQLADHPAAALTVYWPRLGRQVRVRGTVERAADLVAAAEFATRSPDARIGALVGRQSEPLVSCGRVRGGGGGGPAPTGGHPGRGRRRARRLHALGARGRVLAGRGRAPPRPPPLHQNRTGAHPGVVAHPALAVKRLKR